MLTGEAYSEYTDCSGGNLVNMMTKQHDRELMTLYGLEDCYDKLPPLKYSAEICGHVTREASEKHCYRKERQLQLECLTLNACGISSGLPDEEQHVYDCRNME